MGGTLLVLAAGVGRRYGGRKQVDGVGPNGEWLLEYTLHDAHRAGFERAVLVVHPSLESTIRDRLAEGAGRRLDVEYVHEEAAHGTGHAVLCAREAIAVPFAVANADDVYGERSFAVLSAALAGPSGGSWVLVGFALEKTLSPHGPVSRALVAADDEGFLEGIEEHLEIDRGTAPTSMNLWGFTPEVFPLLDDAWRRHREATPNAEFQLPTAVGAFVEAGAARVRVVATPERWLGITWPGDRGWVREAWSTLSGPAAIPHHYGVRRERRSS